MTSRSIWRSWSPVLTGIALACAAAAGRGQPGDQARADYAEVAPILHRQCAGCHNPQGGAPFSLLTYEDAKQWSGQILDVTQSRYMPPWLPAPGKGDFVGERRLSDVELASLRAWVGAGAPGPATSAEHSPPVAASPVWQLGNPDAVLHLATPVNLPGNGPDVFTELAAPIAAREGHALRAIEIHPSDAQAVRNLRIRFAGAQQEDTGEAGSAGILFWSPGGGALERRRGKEWFTTPGGSLVLDAHLKTTGRPVALEMEIALYYDRASGHGQAPARADVLQLTHRGSIEIPAGSADTVIEDSYTLPQTSLVTAIYPRARFLARSFDAYAKTPAGKQIWLLSIPKWDVDWVEAYTYRRAVTLPRGSVIHWRVTYDNSSENPHNPSDPPVAVHGGDGAKDEADTLFLEVAAPAGVDAAAWRRGMRPAAR